MAWRLAWAWHVVNESHPTVMLAERPDEGWDTCERTEGCRDSTPIPQKNGLRTRNLPANLHYVEPYKPSNRELPRTGIVFAMSPR